MKAVVFHGIGDIRLDDVEEPSIEEPTDAILSVSRSAICGTDLHMIRGTFTGMEPGTILGHEAVGVVEEVGQGVRNLRRGDRVVVPSTIACGYCSYCRAGYHAQCDNANPNGKQAGTTFFGGPKAAGGIDGLQAEYIRVPYANTGLVKLPEEVTDDQAILLSDIVPTGYFGAELADIEPGKVVAVFGCGPVGQFAIMSALLMGAGRVIAVDTVASRLDMARAQGAEAINFNQEDPIQTIREMTGGVGVDRVIDAVGVDATRPKQGPGADQARQQAEQFDQERKQVAPETNVQDDQWKPGNAPSQVLDWAVQTVAKAGTVSIIGVYPPTLRSFPIGMAMNRNLTLRMGNCNHRHYLPKLVELTRNGTINPEAVLTQTEPLTDVLDAYHAFDTREPGWMKVQLLPAA